VWAAGELSAGVCLDRTRLTQTSRTAVQTCGTTDWWLCDFASASTWWVSNSPLYGEQTAGRRYLDAPSASTTSGIHIAINKAVRLRTLPDPEDSRYRIDA
jgi:hypothetical protein